MHKTRFSVICLLLISFLLMQCNNKPAQLIEGSWQLQTLEINGTVLQGNTLGNWNWQFDNDGNYNTTVGKAKETGTYTLAENKLTLKSTTYSKRPELVLLVTELDSVQMNLVTAYEKNKTSLRFLKDGK